MRIEGGNCAGHLTSLIVDGVGLGARLDCPSLAKKLLTFNANGVVILQGC